MLVALLSTLERATDGASCPRAFLRMAGNTVIARQVEMALELGCERVICLAEGLSPELVAVQHRVERSGRRFHVVSGRQALHGLITAADEIVIIADGVIPDEQSVAEAIGRRKGVLTFPVEAGIAAGFERVDRAEAWAGVLRCGGADLERLAELPPDIDALSALMRSALQSGRPRIEVSPEHIAHGSWRLVDSARSARELGRRMVKTLLRPSSWFAPGNALVDRVMGIRAEAMLRQPASVSFVLGGGFLALGLGLISAAAGFLIASFAILVCAAALVRAWMAVDQLRQGLGEDASALRRDGAVLALDIAVVAAPLLAGAGRDWTSLAFSLVMLVGLLNLARKRGRDWARSIAYDHMLLFVVLAVATAGNRLEIAVQVLAMLLLVFLFARPDTGRLTRA